jgi:hypothetical protein
MGRYPRIDRDLVRGLYDEHRNVTRVHELLVERGIACSYGTIRSIISGKADSAKGRKTRSRFAEEPVDNRLAKMPAINNPALAEMRTLYPHTVVRDLTNVTMLKSGEHQKKIGGKVLKGKWAGFPVYCLTLEERVTCPVSCRHIRSCYGNQMNWAHRHDHRAPEFEWKLAREVVELGRRHPNGFVVRLHILGDFFSVRYVHLWEALLDQVPALHVYGYTARWGDEIASALMSISVNRWARFAIRFSNAPMPARATVTIEHPMQRPANAFICPVQLGRTESCATCAACWSTKKNVAFVQH